MQITGNKSDSSVLMPPIRQPSLQDTQPRPYSTMTQAFPAHYAAQNPLYFGGLFKTISELAIKAKDFAAKAYGEVKKYCQEVGQALGFVKNEMRRELNANPSQTRSYASEAYANAEAYKASAHAGMVRTIQSLTKYSAALLNNEQTANLGIAEMKDAASAKATCAKLQQAKSDNPTAFRDRHLALAADLAGGLAGDLDAMEQVGTMAELSEAAKDRLENHFLALFRNTSYDDELTLRARTLGKEVLGLSEDTLSAVRQIPSNEIQRFHALMAGGQLPLFQIEAASKAENATEPPREVSQTEAKAVSEFDRNLWISSFSKQIKEKNKSLDGFGHTIVKYGIHVLMHAALLPLHIGTGFTTILLHAAALFAGEKYVVKPMEEKLEWLKKVKHRIEDALPGKGVRQKILNHVEAFAGRVTELKRPKAVTVAQAEMLEKCADSIVEEKPEFATNKKSMQCIRLIKGWVKVLKECEHVEKAGEMHNSTLEDIAGLLIEMEEMNDKLIEKASEKIAESLGLSIHDLRAQVYAKRGEKYDPPIPSPIPPSSGSDDDAPDILDFPALLGPV